MSRGNTVSQDLNPAVGTIGRPQAQSANVPKVVVNSNTQMKDIPVMISQNQLPQATINVRTEGK